MCVYCYIADWGKRFGQDVWIPQPQQFHDFEEILRRVKALEDKLGGCPDEDPAKVDWMNEIRETLKNIEKTLAG